MNKCYYLGEMCSKEELPTDRLECIYCMSRQIRECRTDIKNMQDKRYGKINIKICVDSTDIDVALEKVAEMKILFEKIDETARCLFSCDNTLKESEQE